MNAPATAGACASFTRSIAALGSDFGGAMRIMLFGSDPVGPIRRDHPPYGRRQGTNTHSSASSPHASATPSSVTAMIPAYIEVKSKIW